MPHGSGHHGGGGGGGGHHHFGGGYHGHHFGGGHHGHHFGGGHHGHHFGAGGWGRHHINGVYYGGGPYWHYYRCRCLTWAILSIVLVIIIILTMVSVRYTASNYYDDDGLNYAPTDTHIIPVNNALCQGLALKVDSTLVGYKASLSLLDTRPTLSRSEMFSISDSPYIGYNDYKYYYFYMYPGSKVTVSACLVDGNYAHATFNFIKGNGKFNDWVDDPYSVKNSFVVNAQCNSGNNNSHTYNIKKEDYYYLIFDGNYVTATQLNIYMNFHRTLYEVKNGSVSDSCSVTGDFYGDSCSISVPLSGKTAFLSVYPGAGTDLDMTLGIGLDIECAPRVWMYVMIALSILVGLLLIIVPITACILVKLRKKNAAAASTPAATNTTVNVEVAAAETDTTPLFSNPHPTNPCYQEPPPKYDESGSLPTYKP